MRGKGPHDSLQLLHNGVSEARTSVVFDKPSVENINYDIMLLCFSNYQEQERTQVAQENVCANFYYVVSGVSEAQSMQMSHFYSF